MPAFHDHSAFAPEAAARLAKAIDATCAALRIPPNDTHDREIIAMRIFDLARQGVTDVEALRDRVLQEARSKV